MNRILLASAFLLVSISAAFADEIPSAVPAALGQVPAAVSPAPKAPAPKLVEPHLHIARSNVAGHARVALTFDACMGQADERILSTLVRERIPATIFVTAAG